MGDQDTLRTKEFNFLQDSCEKAESRETVPKKKQKKKTFRSVLESSSAATLAGSGKCKATIQLLFLHTSQPDFCSDFIAFSFLLTWRFMRETVVELSENS